MSMSAEEALLFRERALDVIECDYETGLFRRKIKTNGRCKDGWFSGSKNSGGYTELYVLARHIYGHHLVWILHNGSVPKYQIDHENGDRSDNRIVNLRDVPPTENMRNVKRYITNTSGQVGVSWDKRRNKWAAHITVNYTMHHLGRFTDLADAIAARKEAEIFYGFHANHGRRT